jgi:hypothetical protein
LADFELGIVVDNAHSRSDSTSEEWRTAEVESGRNHGEAILGNNRFIIKCGDPTCINGLVAPTVFGCLALQSATRTPVKNDMITRLHAGNTLPYPLNDAGTLVSEKMRKKFVWAFGGFNFIDLRSANSAVVDAHMNLTECELVWQLEFGDFERSVGLDKDGGEHGKEKPETGNLRLEAY